MYKGALLQQYLKNQKAVYKRLLADGLDYLSEDEIFSILKTVTDLPYNEVILEGLSEEEIFKKVGAYIQSNGKALGVVKHIVDEDDIEWLFVDSDNLEKAMVQHSGEVWVIHQNDADPHPSLPHAHNYEAGTKLDLYNGNIYRKKQQIGKMKQKEFDALQAKIKSNFPNINFKTT